MRPAACHVQLWGGGAPFKQLGDAPNNKLRDSRGTTVQMIGDVAEVLADLHRRQEAGEQLMAAVASRSDEPDWARECLRKFIVLPGLTMMDVMTEKRCEIYKGSKRTHFEALRQKTKIPFDRMCFFDDDPHNIRDVGTLGVHCFHTPQGVTRQIYERALAALSADSS